MGTAGGGPPLQTLLRRGDTRVMQAAVSAMARIDDPAAARAIHKVLQATAGPARAAVIEALVGLKDARVVPILGRLLQDSQPFGHDHALVLETLGALASIRGDGAIPQVAALARARRWRAWGKTQAVRTSALRTLRRIGSPRSQQAFDDLARTGDFFLKRLARSAAVLQEAR